MRGMRSVGLFASAIVGACGGASEGDAELAQEVATVTSFTATETLDPGAGIGYFLALGELQCPGHEPTGNPLQPCPEGSRTHIRGVSWVARMEASDPRFDGWGTVTATLLYGPDFTGPERITYTLDVDDGGTWTGSCEGRRTRSGTGWVDLHHCTGDGSDGIVDGQKVFFTLTITSAAALEFTIHADIEGEVLDPHGA